LFSAITRTGKRFMTRYFRDKPGAMPSGALRCAIFRPDASRSRCGGVLRTLQVGCTMGTTATSLHVLSAVVFPESRLPADIEKAYRKLGYARPKKTSGGATKRLILAPDASGDWLSIYDSDNDQIDTGELKQLALEVTKRLGTVALLTSVYDSDTRSHTVETQVRTRDELEQLGSALLEPLFPVARGIRLLGISLSSLRVEEAERERELGLPL
jgi:hypothetical protein